MDGGTTGGSASDAQEPVDLLIQSIWAEIDFADELLGTLMSLCARNINRAGLPKWVITAGHGRDFTKIMETIYLNRLGAEYWREDQLPRV